MISICSCSSDSNLLSLLSQFLSFSVSQLWKCRSAESRGRWKEEDSNLVDSASSHTLVSKIKPCMSKYKYFTLKLRTAHYISYSLFDSPLLLG